ncbi:hypothetical protein [Mangrovihabitans endophyticus]|uniref:Uncharacterized protein n=1 Tax=Mangrovihabitans endophyticus TaxID=1751298 RepID=A0A8J3C552_9ACTN|nr:hypothetical protein [Mangrovihabitans endophyticus]GGL20035.1 hypothetical protein GCM10012284_63290 [Mangrovihabitans endophyticus]
MTALIGLAGVIVGALLSAITTYFTMRSTKRIELEHAYDRALRDKRLESYQRLFHVSKCLPRYWRAEETPTRQDLRRYRRDFHDWYFGEDAGGLFLSDAAKGAYLRLLNSLAEVALTNRDVPEGSQEPPLSAEESRVLRALASELRHQLAADIGTANPPRLQWTRPSQTISPPPSVTD